MRIVAIIAVALGVTSAFAGTVTNNNFECFAPEQNADIALFTRDLRVFKLIQAGKTTTLKLDRKAISLQPTRLLFKESHQSANEAASVRLELTFEEDNSDHANGALTGLIGGDAPIHWICARQLYGP